MGFLGPLGCSARGSNEGTYFDFHGQFSILSFLFEYPLILFKHKYYYMYFDFYLIICMNV